LHFYVQGAFQLRLLDADLPDAVAPLRETLRNINIDFLREHSLKLLKFLRIRLITKSLLHHTLKLLLVVSFMFAGFLRGLRGQLGHFLRGHLDESAVLLPIFLLESLDALLHQLLLLLFEL